MFKIISVNLHESKWFRHLSPHDLDSTTDSLLDFFSFLSEDFVSKKILSIFESESEQKETFPKLVIVGGSVWNMIRSQPLSKQKDLDIRVFHETLYRDLLDTFTEYKKTNSTLKDLKETHYSFSVTLLENGTKKTIDVSKGFFQDPEKSYFSSESSLMIGVLRGGKLKVFSCSRNNCVNFTHLVKENPSSLQFDPNIMVRNKPLIFLRYILSLGRGTCKKISGHELKKAFNVTELWELVWKDSSSLLLFLAKHSTPLKIFKNSLELVTTELLYDGSNLWDLRISKDMFDVYEVFLERSSDKIKKLKLSKEMFGEELRELKIQNKENQKIIETSDQALNDNSITIKQEKKKLETLKTLHKEEIDEFQAECRLLKQKTHELDELLQKRGDELSKLKKEHSKQSLCLTHLKKTNISSAQKSKSFNELNQIILEQKIELNELKLANQSYNERINEQRKLLELVFHPEIRKFLVGIIVSLFLSTHFTTATYEFKNLLNLYSDNEGDAMIDKKNSIINLNHYGRLNFIAFITSIILFSSLLYNNYKFLKLQNK